MGSLRALVLLALVGACETSGIEVEVVMPPDGPAPDHVRLFIGSPSEDDQARIGPEKFGVSRPGSRWVRDKRDYDDVIEVTPGTEVSFGFVSEIDHEELGAIIAVGYTDGVPTSAGSLFHVKAGVGNVRVFALKMFPAVDPRIAANRNAQVQLEIWGPEPGDESCIHLWNKHPERDMYDPHDSAFIVTKDNRDCDRWDDGDPLECSADIHEANTPPQPHDLVCTTSTTLPGGVSCTLGGPPCVDGSMVDAQCAPSRFCAPPSVCGACEGLAGDQLRDCIRAPFDKVPATSGQMYGLKCFLPRMFDPNDMTAPGRLCAASATVMLQVPTMNPPLACSNAMIARVGERLGGRIEIDQMRFDVSVNAQCMLTLTPSGPVAMATALSAQFNGLVTADLDNGRSLALPLEIYLGQLNTNCDNLTPSCSYVGEMLDRPFHCAGTPRTDP